MTYKGLPATHVSLAYGLSFRGLAPLQVKLAEASGHPPVDFFDVYTDTSNRPLGGKERRSAVADYNSCDFGQVYNDLLGGAESELLAFFSRSGDLREVRLSLERGDGSFFSGGREPIITAIDYLLGDFRHLRQFHESLGDSYRARMVERAAEVFGVPL